MEQSLEKSLYHSFLRVAVSVVAFALVFDSGLILKSTALMSDFTQAHLANVVGVTVGVEPNEVNQLTARITELETEVAAKERLIAVNLRDSNESTIDKSTFFLSAVLFLLLVLIVLNYVLDYRRDRNAINNKQYADTPRVA